MRPTPRTLGTNFLTAAAYVVISELGRWGGIKQPQYAPLWDLTGFALAAVLLLGFRVWAGLLLGSVVASALALWSPVLNGAEIVGGALLVGGAEAAQVLAAAWVINRFAAGREALLQPHTIIKFVVLTAAVCLLVGAPGVVAGDMLTGLASGQNLAGVWFASWLGSFLSAIVITPFILAWASWSTLLLSFRRIAEAGILAFLLVLLCLIIFQQLFGAETRSMPVAFLVVPVQLWSAWRFGQRGTTAVTFVVACFAVAGTLHGLGPFALAQSHTSFLLLQNFLAVISIMSLLLAADIKQRQAGQHALRESEQRYRDLFEYNPQPMWLFDYESLDILAANQAAVQDYGYSRAELFSMQLTDLWSEADRPALLKMLSQSRQGLDLRFDSRQMTKSGRAIDVNITGRNLLHNGRPAAVLLSEDITERKRAEKQTAAFAELARRLSAVTTAHEAARFVMGTADLLFGWDSCIFELCSERKTGLVTILAVDTVGGERKDVTTECHNTGSGAHTLQALKEGARLILRPDPAHFAPDMFPFGDKLRPSASLMFAPVRVENEAIAVLSVQSYRPQNYSEGDLRLFQGLADHCGGALNRVRAEGALRESAERLRLALTAGQMGTWSAELKGERLLRISPELESIFGLTAGDYNPSPQALLQLVHPDYRKIVRRAMVKVLRAEGDYELEFRFLPRDRPPGWMFARGRAYGGAPGHAPRVAGVAMDITSRKTAEQEILRLNAELERRVGERTAQLEATNKELEAFSYSVSHDLRAPLRSIRGFSEVLLERYSAQLDERGQEFLRRASESAQHMDKLIEDLLKLSRVGRSELQHRDVDLSALAEGICGELTQSQPDRQVSLSIGAGLRARGDERLLRIVLENLLRNAWKFSSKKNPPKVEFGVTSTPQPAFFVKDNGAGFDMAYASKLFGVFQRLHSASEFPGTGVGLATVQRIINRHGGRVWAEAEPERGATFYFTLPDNEGQ